MFKITIAKKGMVLQSIIFLLLEKLVIVVLYYIYLKSTGKQT